VANLAAGWSDTAAGSSAGSGPGGVRANSATGMSPRDVCLAKLLRPSAPMSPAAARFSGEAMRE
jgi:hypothetical protein